MEERVLRIATSSCVPAHIRRLEYFSEHVRSQQHKRAVGFYPSSKKETLMLQLTSLLKTLAVSIAVLVTTAGFAATSENQPAKPSHEVIKTYLRADLSLKSVLSPEFAALASTDTAAATLRTCRCSCGFRCTTDADCGPGGRCTAGITCCASTPGTSSTGTLQGQGKEASSSNAHPESEPLNVNCRQE